MKEQFLWRKKKKWDEIQESSKRNGDDSGKAQKYRIKLEKKVVNLKKWIQSCWKLKLLKNINVWLKKNVTPYSDQ